MFFFYFLCQFCNSLWTLTISSTLNARSVIKLVGFEAEGTAQELRALAWSDSWTEVWFTAHTLQGTQLPGTPAVGQSDILF